MINPTALRLQTTHEGVDWAQLEGLFTLTDLGGRKGDKLRRAFLNSTNVCYAFDGARLVGVARAISDGEYHAVVYDVAVHPDYQKQGIGRTVMNGLLQQIRVWRVMLIASEDVQPFYGRLGFDLYPDALAKLDWTCLCDASADATADSSQV
jgi:aralkylamine N-acetyltransferase